jgi:hypothetical protein
MPAALPAAATAVQVSVQPLHLGAGAQSAQVTKPELAEYTVMTPAGPRRETRVVFDLFCAETEEESTAIANAAGGSVGASMALRSLRRELGLSDEPLSDSDEELLQQEGLKKDERLQLRHATDAMDQALQRMLATSQALKRQQEARGQALRV